MKKILSVNNISKSTGFALLILRVGIASLMLTHGIPKLGMLLSGGPIQFPPMLGMSAKLSLGLTVFAEVFGSVLLLIGFATRLATIPLIITMSVALIFVHAADPIGVKEPALYYLLVYTGLLFAGSGKYSIDYLLLRQTIKNYHPKLQPEDPTRFIYQ